jgi:3-deoxy-D-manno-octulosonate 8-phosphate phosphatase (KDO 8-P phosphatase)
MEAVLERARRVELLLLDVDGVLTDGRILILSDGREGKFFHFHDGHGIRLARQAGLTVGLLSARSSEATAVRARELGLTICVQDARDKLTAGRRIADDCGVTLEQMAYMGDDVLDVPLMPHVGLAVAPVDARPEAKAVAHWVTDACGGHGAVRELTDLLIQARSSGEPNHDR